MRIESIMTRKVFKVRMDDSIGTMKEIIENFAFHHLLVVEGKKLVGILSDRDILSVISPFLNTLSERGSDLAILNKRAHQIMTRNPITVSKETSIEEASRLLLEKNISCLPVISPEGEIDGIVTWKDILKFYRQAKSSK